MRYLPLLLLPLLLHAEEIFLPAQWLDAEGIESTQHSYCQNIPARPEPFCEKSALSYPVFPVAPDPQVARQIAQILQPAIEKEKKVDLKKAVVEVLGEFKEDPPPGTWESSEAITLFTLTPKTFTLRSALSSYTGGAHGSYSIHYSNHLIGSDGNRSLTLDDLLLPGYLPKLTMIAERFYKEQRGLKPSQSLTDDGWFENKFILPAEFAITSRGLLFHYNSYEIKAYAYGHTSFLLPYFMFTDLIRPDGAIGTFTQNPKITTAHFRSKLGDLLLKFIRIDTKTLKVEASLKNQNSADHLWLSLSFPQLRKKESIRTSQQSGFDALHLYGAGSTVYHIQKKKGVRSHYLLAEADLAKVKYDTQHKLSMTLGLSSSLSYLKIRIRVVTKIGKRFEKMPDEFEGVTGQQGFHNYEVVIPLRD